MNIVLKPNENPIKHRPYILNPQVKDKVKKEINKMIVVRLIFLVDEVEWIRLIVIQDRKYLQGIKVCVDYRSINNDHTHDPFPTHVSDRALNNVAGNEDYSFTDGFFGYHQVHIAEEDKKKNTFTIEWGSYGYNFMSFGLKNASVAFSRVVIIAIRNYIHKFLEVYMDDWTTYSLLK